MLATRASTLVTDPGGRVGRENPARTDLLNRWRQSAQEKMLDRAGDLSKAPRDVDGCLVEATVWPELASASAASYASGSRGSDTAPSLHRLSYVEGAQTWDDHHRRLWPTQPTHVHSPQRACTSHPATDEPASDRGLAKSCLADHGGRAAVRESPRNPFDVADVPDPEGQDVVEFAAAVPSEEGAGDVPDSLDGEWTSRWNGGVDTTIPGDTKEAWKSGRAEIVARAGVTYVFFDWDGGRRKGLLEARRERPDRLVGKYVNVTDPTITRP
jgi:hypothetical protein